LEPSRKGRLIDPAPTPAAVDEVRLGPSGMSVG